jgi:hypothetical protein
LDIIRTTAENKKKGASDKNKKKEEEWQNLKQKVMAVLTKGNSPEFSTAINLKHMVQWYTLDGDAVLAKNRVVLVKQHDQTKHILVEDVISLGAATATATDTDTAATPGHASTVATVSLGAAAFTSAGQEPFAAAFLLGAAAAEQEVITATASLGTAAADGETKSTTADVSLGAAATTAE